MDKAKYKIPIYGGTAHFIFFSKEEIEEVKKKYQVSKIEEYDAVTLYYDRSSKWTILFHKDRITPGIIAHEAKHLLNLIFQYNGLRLDLDNDEAECYFLGWIVNRIHETTRRFSITIK